MGGSYDDDGDAHHDGRVIVVRRRPGWLAYCTTAVAFDARISIRLTLARERTVELDRGFIERIWNVLRSRLCIQTSIAARSYCEQTHTIDQCVENIYFCDTRMLAKRSCRVCFELQVERYPESPKKCCCLCR